MQQHHIILNATRCGPETLRNKDMIEEFMRKLAYATNAQIVHGPTVILRKGTFPGVTAIAITHSAHLIIHTFGPEREAIIEIYSYIAVDTSKATDLFIRHFREDISNVKIVDFTKWRYEELECEEPGCSRKATRDWKGRKVCQDHYDTYRDYEERMQSAGHEND